jgi:hypothetical protein
MVKRFLIKIAFIGLIGVMGSSVVYAQGTSSQKQDEVPYPKVYVKVEGACEDAVCGDGYLINSTSYVPLRVIIESMGAEVKWDGQSQTATIVRSPGTGSEEKTKADAYVSDTLQLLEMMENELDNLSLMEYQFQLMAELYDEFNDIMRYEVISKDKIWKHQNAMNDISKQLLEYQGKYKDQSSNVLKIVNLSDEINSIINHYKLAADMFQNYMATKNKDEYKRMLLYRTYAMDKIETVNLDLNKLRESFK